MKNIRFRNRQEMDLACSVDLKALCYEQEEGGMGFPKGWYWSYVVEGLQGDRLSGPVHGPYDDEGQCLLAALGEASE